MDESLREGAATQTKGTRLQSFRPFRFGPLRDLISQVVRKSACRLLRQARCDDVHPAVARRPRFNLKAHVMLRGFHLKAGVLTDHCSGGAHVNKLRRGRTALRMPDAEFTQAAEGYSDPGAGDGVTGYADGIRAA